MKNDNQKNQEQNMKRGLAFAPFHKIRKTRDSKNVLIYLNEGCAISVSVKYLEKVLADTKGEE